MRKLLLYALCLGFLNSCSISLTPLKGKYPVEYSFTSTKAVEEIWRNIINYCSKNSLKISREDRGSGTILVEEYRFTSYAFENPDGTPQITNAYIVIGCEKKEGKYNCLRPEVIKSEIYFTIREENSKTSISIALPNIKASWGFNNKTGQPYYFRDVKSIGTFERELAEMIK